MKSEIGSLAAGVERSADAVEKRLGELESELKRVRKASAKRLDEIERARSDAPDDGLGERIDELERRLERESARSEAQAAATESALRDGLRSLGEQLAGTGESYVEAGDSLRRSIERLGASIGEAESIVASRGTGDRAWAAPELTGPCLAFVPNGDGYTLQELELDPPAVGEEVAVADAGEFVVARVGRSPLPLDRRPCVYLEAR